MIKESIREGIKEMRMTGSHADVRYAKDSTEIDRQYSAGQIGSDQIDASSGSREKTLH